MQGQESHTSPWKATLGAPACEYRDSSDPGFQICSERHKNRTNLTQKCSLFPKTKMLKKSLSIWQMTFIVLTKNPGACGTDRASASQTGGGGDK